MPNKSDIVDKPSIVDRVIAIATLILIAGWIFQQTAHGALYYESLSCAELIESSIERNSHADKRGGESEHR